MKLQGTIEIDSTRKTVTIRLENGSYCLDHYTHGIKHFLDEEIACCMEELEPIEHELSPIIPVGIGESARPVSDILRLCGFPKGWEVVND